MSQVLVPKQVPKFPKAVILYRFEVERFSSYGSPFIRVFENKVSIGAPLHLIILKTSLSPP